MQLQYGFLPLAAVFLALTGCGGGSDEQEAVCFDNALYVENAQVKLTYERSGALSGKESWSSTVTSVNATLDGVSGLVTRREERTPEGSSTNHTFRTERLLAPGVMAQYEMTRYNSAAALLSAVTERYSPAFIDERAKLAVGQTATYRMQGERTYTGPTGAPVTAALDDAVTVTFVGKENIQVPAGLYATCRYNAITQSTGNIVTQWVRRGVVVREESGGTVRSMVSGTFNGAPL